MSMILTYYFEDIECEVEYDAIDHINNGWNEPHSHRELCNVDYDYEVEVEFEDFLDFIKPYDFDRWNEVGKDAYIRACKDVWNSNWFGIDLLEEDNDFIEFMHDRYEEQAREECERENEDY